MLTIFPIFDNVENICFRVNTILALEVNTGIYLETFENEMYGIYFVAYNA